MDVGPVQNAPRTARRGMPNQYTQPAPSPKGSLGGVGIVFQAGAEDGVLEVTSLAGEKKPASLSLSSSSS